MQVFDDGDFSEDDTFLLTDWLAHIPKDVLAKNFQTDVSAFDKIPGQELYIFPAGWSPVYSSQVPKTHSHPQPTPLLIHLHRSVPKAQSRTHSLSRCRRWKQLNCQAVQSRLWTRASSRPRSPSLLLRSPLSPVPCASSTGTRPKMNGVSSCESIS